MNKALFLCFLFIAAVITADAQQTIDIKDVSKHVGDSVTVCAKIFSGKFLDKANNQPTFLNVGGEYPRQLLTIVIWGSVRKLFQYKPEEKLKNKNVCVSGRVELFNGKPEIVIHSVSQIREQ